MARPNAKGSGFEREVAKQLSLWSSNNKDAFIFSRRSGSGGAARDITGSTGSGGDIFADKQAGKWLTNHTVFELKFYQDLKGDLWNYLADGKGGKLEEFIKQSKSSAKPYNRTWTLIFKCNRYAAFVLTDSKCLQEVIQDPVIIKRSEGDLYLFKFEKLLSSSPSNLQRCVKTHKAN